MKRSFKTWHRWYRIKRHQEAAALPAHDIACPCCASHVILPALKQGEKADCPRCHYPLVHIERNPYKFPIAYALTILILLSWIFLANFMSVSIIGPSEILTLPDMIENLWHKEFKSLSIIMFLMTFGIPFMFAILNLKIFIALITNKNNPTLQTATRMSVALKPWMMQDVFFIGSVVSLVKIQAMASISFHAAFAFVFAIMIIITRLGIHGPKHWLYAKLALLSRPLSLRQQRSDVISCSQCYFYQPKHHSHCDICNHKLYYRKPNSLQWSFALLIAAILLYIPANALPMMISSSVLTGSIASTIFDGTILMWNDGDYFIAFIIFTASIFVPIAKILAMLILLFSAKYKLLASPHRLSKLYHAVELVGRWSMIDVFVIVILMSSFATPMANVLPGPATMYFCLVVILTMLSANCFDTRLLWDKYQQEQQNSQEPLKHESS